MVAPNGGNPAPASPLSSFLGSVLEAGLGALIVLALDRIVAWVLRRRHCKAILLSIHDLPIVPAGRRPQEMPSRQELANAVKAVHRP